MSTPQYYYFDANALWKYYRPGEKETGSQELRRLVANKAIPMFVSPLTLLEMFGILMRYRRQRILRQRAVNKVVKRLRHDITLTRRIRDFKMCAMPERAFHTAEEILLRYAGTFSISSNDALHVAIMKNLQETFPGIILVTSDGSMQQVCHQLQIKCFDPEQEETCFTQAT